MFDIVADNLKTARHREKTYYDLRSTSEKLKEGDLVLLKKHVLNPNELRTFATNYYAKIFVVKRVLSDATIVISTAEENPTNEANVQGERTNPDDSKDIKIVHFNSLKKYTPPPPKEPLRRSDRETAVRRIPGQEPIYKSLN